MKLLSAIILFILLLTLLSGCSRFRKENPLKIKCPSCGYIWDNTPTRPY